jgi:uncharacterized membrane protein
VIREQLAKNRVHKPTAFRWRGGDVSRLEGLSDAVFGFAITLLVVSLEVPHTFAELANAMRGFTAFAVCFAMLALVWYEHYIFFRQYGLRDTWTVVLNLVLLFVVMFYVYPLKFMFTLLANLFLGAPAASVKAGITQHEMCSLMMIYGAGFVAVYGLFVLLYANAYRQRAELNLNALELHDTRASIGCDLVLISIGVISILMAASRTAPFAPFSGPIYFLIGPSMGIYWTIMGGRRRKLEDAQLATLQHKGGEDE